MQVPESKMQQLCTWVRTASFIYIHCFFSLSLYMPLVLPTIEVVASSE